MVCLGRPLPTVVKYYGACAQLSCAEQVSEQLKDAFILVIKIALHCCMKRKQTSMPNNS